MRGTRLAQNYWQGLMKRIRRVIIEIFATFQGHHSYIGSGTAASHLIRQRVETHINVFITCDHIDLSRDSHIHTFFPADTYTQMGLHAVHMSGGKFTNIALAHPRLHLSEKIDAGRIIVSGLQYYRKRW